MNCLLHFMISSVPSLIQYSVFLLLIFLFDSSNGLFIHVFILVHVLLADLFSFNYIIPMCSARDSFNLWVSSIFIYCNGKLVLYVVLNLRDIVSNKNWSDPQFIPGIVFTRLSDDFYQAFTRIHSISFLHCSQEKSRYMAFVYAVWTQSSLLLGLCWYRTK